MDGANNLSTRSTQDLIKEVGVDVQQLVTKEIALAKAESSIAMHTELAAARTLALAAALALIGTGMGLTAVLIGIFGWKMAAIVGGVMLLASSIPAYIGLRTHDNNPIPQTRDSLREEAKWIKTTFSKTP